MYATRTAMVENGKRAGCIYVYARGACSCASWLPMNCAPFTCAYLRSLLGNGYFVLYQRSSQRIQRWRPVNVHLQTIRTMNSRFVRCGEEQLLGKGRTPATRMVYLQIASGRITAKCQGHYSRGCYTAPEPSHMPLLHLFIAHFHFHSPHALLISLCLKLQLRNHLHGEACVMCIVYA